MNDERGRLAAVLDETVGALRQASLEQCAELRMEEYGEVTYVGNGVVRVKGLPGVRAEELVRFPNDLLGMALNLDPEEVGVILLDEGPGLAAGSAVRRTNRVLDVPVGEALLGRVVDPVGRPLDTGGPVEGTIRAHIEAPAPAIVDRAPVTVPLATGIKVVDALIPIGRGQRELILGDRQTGKTGIAVDTIINQRDKHVKCIYCAKFVSGQGDRGPARTRRHAVQHGSIRVRRCPSGAVVYRTLCCHGDGRVLYAPGQRRARHIRRPEPACTRLPRVVPLVAAASGA